MKKIINPFTVYLQYEESKHTTRVTPRLKVRDNRTRKYIKELGGRLDFYIWGKSDITNRIKAEQERDKLQVDLNANGYNPDDNQVDDFILFIAEIANEKSKGTKSGYLSAKNVFIEFLQAESLLFSKATEELFSRFRKWLLEKYTKQNSASNVFTKIMAVEHIAERRKYIKEAVIVKRIPMVKSIKDYLNLSEIELLAKTYCEDEEVKRAFLFDCFSGPRISDLMTLMGKNIKNENGEYTLRYITIKTHVLVNNYLNAIVEEFLPKNIGNNELLFPSLAKYDASELNRILETWIKRAGIDKHITMHCGRVTYGVMIMEQTGNIKAVMQALGHKSILSAEWAYGHLKPKTERNATKLDGLDVPVVKMINNPHDKPDDNSQDEPSDNPKDNSDKNSQDKPNDNSQNKSDDDSQDETNNDAKAA